MSQQPGLMTKTFAVIGFFWLVWVVLSIFTSIPGPFGINQ